MASQCDINLIVKRFTETGQIAHVARKEPIYGDFTAADDLATMLNTIRAAEADFAALPSAVRRAAKEDPVEMLRMLASEEGHQELIDAENPRAAELRKEAEAIAHASEIEGKAPLEKTDTEN